MKRTPKNKKKLIGYGAIITLVLVFIISIAFASLKLPDGLSIFLTVLITGIFLFVYYLVFTAIEGKIEQKKKDKVDPFNF